MIFKARNIGIYCILFCIHSSVFADQVAKEKKEIQVFVFGKAYEKQIYLLRENRRIQITRFKPWENILRYSLSSDQNRVVVYHRSDKETSHRLSVYKRRNQKWILEKSLRPGVACHKLFWHRDKIIFETGTSGGGTFLLIYDQNLALINTIGSFDFHMDPDLGIAISKPVYSAEEGKFLVFSLNSGRLLETFDYRKEVGENYSVSNIEKKNFNRFEIEVEDLDTNQKRKFIKYVATSQTKTRSNK